MPDGSIWQVLLKRQICRRNFVEHIPEHNDGFVASLQNQSGDTVKLIELLNESVLKPTLVTEKNRFIERKIRNFAKNEIRICDCKK